MHIFRIVDNTVCIYNQLCPFDIEKHVYVIDERPEIFAFKRVYNVSIIQPIIVTHTS